MRGKSCICVNSLRKVCSRTLGQKSFIPHLEAGHLFRLVEFSTKTKYTRHNLSTTLGPIDTYPDRLHTTDRLNVYSPSN